MHSSGTHTTCKCVLCENPELKVSTSVIGENPNIFGHLVGENNNKKTVKMEDLVPLIVGDPEDEDCVIGLKNHISGEDGCENCTQKTDNFKNKVNQIFKNEGIDSVTWTGWDFADKEKDPRQEFTLDSEEFTDSLFQSIQEYRRHKAITAKQDDSIKTLRKNVPPHQAVVVMDYSENYKVQHQDEVQTAYYRDKQISMLGAYAYYNTGDGEGIKEKGMVVLSDCLNHKTEAVYTGYRHIQDTLKEYDPELKKTILVTDGCAAQFKNCKQFANMCHHQEDFNNDAEWVFSTTGHGKAAVDGMNGSLKRQADHASLYMGARNTITSAQGFHQWNENRTTARGEKSKVKTFVINQEDGTRQEQLPEHKVFTVLHQRQMTKTS